MLGNRRMNLAKEKASCSQKLGRTNILLTKHDQRRFCGQGTGSHDDIEQKDCYIRREHVNCAQRLCRIS
jgi:hypothetical protein